MSSNNVFVEDKTAEQKYLVRMQLLLFTVRVTLIRVVTGGPHQHPILLPDVTNRNIPLNLGRQQYLNLCFFAKKKKDIRDLILYFKTNIDSEALISVSDYIFRTILPFSASSGLIALTENVYGCCFLFSLIVAES